jgi:3-phosphoshikimate 1-carboxyvinyltransferase
MDAAFSAPSGIKGVIRPPADKSLTHRALMLAAVAEGESRVSNPLETGDCLSTRKILEALGVEIRPDGGGGVVVRGRGLRGFSEPSSILDAENSGTAMRLFSGLLAGLPIFAVMTGDDSLRSRPMARAVEPLRRMGGGSRRGTAESTPPCASFRAAEVFPPSGMT